MHEESAGGDTNRREPSWLLIVLVACIAAAATIISVSSLLPHGTVNLDEVAYQSQANALQHGNLTLPRATHDPDFRPFLSGFHDDRIVFKYQPVWPALIAASDFLFDSSVPLRALLNALGVLAVAWLAFELTRDRRVALASAVIICVSPFTWVQSATLLSYQLSFVLGVAATTALLRALRLQNWPAGLIAGGFVGLEFFHRPYDAIIALAPVAIYMLCVSRNRSLLVLAGRVIVGALPFAALFLLYNYAVMDNPFRVPFDTAGSIDKFGFGWRASFVAPGSGHAGQVHFTVGHAFEALGNMLTALPRFIAAAPVVVLLAIVSVWKRPRDAHSWLLVGLFVSMPIGYFFWWGPANAVAFGLENSLGPFYYYPVLAPLAVLAARGMFEIRWNRTMLVGTAAIAMVWVVGASIDVTRVTHGQGRGRTSDVNSTRGPPDKRLVIIPPAFPRDPYVRLANQPDLSGSRLVALDAPNHRLDIIDRFPDRGPILVLLEHEMGKPFSAPRRRRVPLEIVRGPALTVSMEARVPDEAAARTYFEVEGGELVVGDAGSGVLEDSFPLTTDDLGPDIRTVTVGYSIGGVGGAAPEERSDERFECRFEARVHDGEIEAITPCDGWVHYVFGENTFATPERLGDRLVVEVDVAD